MASGIETLAESIDSARLFHFNCRLNNTNSRKIRLKKNYFTQIIFSVFN
jgi:hypothetical protein